MTRRVSEGWLVASAWTSRAASSGTGVASVAISAWAASVLAAGCCFGGVPNLPPGFTPPSVPPTPPVTTPVVGGGSATLVLAPGFAPDPSVVTGVAGGPVSAASFGPSCRGNLSATPSLLLTTSGDFPSLRLVVNSDVDTTLVVRLSNGVVLCDDDGGGSLNPLIQSSFPPGQHQVFVGTYSAGTTGTFTLGATVNPAVSFTQLQGVPQVVATGGAIPTVCGLAVPQFGPLAVGTAVTLGAHSPYTGPNGQGGVIAAGTPSELNWSPEMQPYVGQRTTVTALEGIDDAGCTVVTVAADSGQFHWRIRDMHL